MPVVAVLLGVGLPVAALAIDRSSQSETAEPTARPVVVSVASVRYGDGYERTRRFTGVVEARRTTDLGFRFGGLLAEVTAGEGAKVEAGDVLAVLDTDALEASRSVRAAQLEAGRARLAELEAGPRTEEIAAARGRVAAAEARLARLRLDLNRVTEAFDRGAAVESEVDRASFAVDEAGGELTEARERLLELERGTRAERLDAQRAEVARLEAELAQIDVDLNDASLVAPFSGTVAKHLSDEGRVVGAGQAVVRLVETGSLEVWVGVPRETAASIEVGSRHVLSGPRGEINATAKAVMPELDTVTRTARVVFSVPEGSGLFSGDVVRFEERVRERVDGFWVPMDGLTEGRRGMWRAYVAEPVEDGSTPAEGGWRIVSADVELLFAEGDRAYVRGSVPEGAMLVTTGSHRVAPGQRVSIEMADVDGGSR